MTSRGKNFTEREKCKLLELVQKFKHIIENKCTNAVTTTVKNDAWKSIADEFNSSAETPRTQKQLSTAYMNLKRCTRKNVANENVKNYLALKQNMVSCDEGQIITFIDESNIPSEPTEIKNLLKQLKKDEITDKKGVMATGGGIYKPVLSSVGAQMLAVMGDQVAPLSNNCDSASNYYKNSQDVSTYDDMPKEMLGPSGSQINNNVPPVNKVQHKRTVPTQKKRNINNKDLKTKYYQKKLESAVLEKKTKILEYKMTLRKQKLIELEIKIKEKEYDLLNK